MNEDFVSFELAKKLKEKGFREKCLCRYKNYSKTLHINEVEPKIARKIDYSEFFKCYNSYVDSDIDAPTISQVLKWLRDEKELFVEVSVNNHTGFDFYFTIYEKSEECWIVCGFNEEWYDTHEGAALSGIEYVIDNLI